jgi:hypothetical protein
MGVSRIFWLWDPIMRDSRLVAWAIAILLGLVVLVGMIALTRLWPLSRRWAIASRLNRVASEIELEIRRDTRANLDESLRSLASARRECVEQGDDRTAKLEGLIHRIEVTRDRVATSYVPSPANYRRGTRPPDLERLSASAAVAAQSTSLRAETHETSVLDASQIDKVWSLLAELDEGWLSLS